MIEVFRRKEKRKEGRKRKERKEKREKRKKERKERKHKEKERKGLFRPAKNKEIAKIIRMDSVKDAKHSIAEIKKMLAKGEISINEAIKYVNCVENRAKVQDRRKNLSKAEKEKFKKVAKVYGNFKEKLMKAKKVLDIR